MLQVSVRQGGTISPCYLSPEGKRFTSLDQVKAQVQEKERQREEERRRRRKRKRKQTEAEPDTSEPVAKKLRFEGEAEESQGEAAGVRSLPAEILKRRRLMTARSPFRNLLKRTLVRNHVRVRGRMVPPPPPATTSSSSKRSSDEEEDDDDSEDFNPPSKKPRTAPAAAVTPPRPPATPMFPPPNLTPPVVRRPQPDPKDVKRPQTHPQEVSRRPQGDPKEVRRPPISAITFASPNQRPLTSRLSKQGGKGPASPAACKPAPS